jgi:RNA polymerase sigma-70 factor (ECF subfamily)
LTKEEFKICFDQFFDPLRNYLYFRSGNKEIAQDICQETFMKIWEKQPEFDLNRIKGLLYKIAGNSFIDHVRKNNVSNKHLSQVELHINHNTPEDELHFQELKQKYEVALSQLTENQRITFLMNRMEGLTYREIAIRLDISQKAVEKRMSLALASLKEELR